jgi:hypothetical protein
MIVGCGKSITMYELLCLLCLEKLTTDPRTTVIDEAHIEAQKTGRPVLYYFFHHSFPRYLTARALFESYIKQILYHLASVKKTCPSVIIEQVINFYESKKRPPSLEEVVDEILIPLLAIIGDSILIADGLDECNSNEIQKTLVVFKKILATSSSRAFIACREEIDIIRRIQGSVRIRITPEKTKGDMELFVEHRLEEMQSTRRISDQEEMLAYVKEELLKKADRM